MFSEISELQLSNGVSHLSLWQFWIFEFFHPPPSTPLINWQNWTKLKTYCITCFQKSQNTSFPTVYHTWVYDNFEIFNFFTPPFYPPLINWQKNTKSKTYSITCFQKSQNTSFPMVYHTWVYDNFDFFNFFHPPPSTSPPHKLVKIYKIKNI